MQFEAIQESVFAERIVGLAQQVPLRCIDFCQVVTDDDLHAI
jgi:hypothetical protein